MAKAKKQWIDPKGLIIPADRVTKFEKKKERVADRLLRQAQDINNRLQVFKDECRDLCHDIYEQALEEKGVTGADRKGNFTFYNFGESIKVETRVSERIDFDDAGIEAAKAKFDEFMNNATESVDDAFVRSLISDAFATRRGKLDVKKVFDLIGKRKRVDKDKYPLFHEAIDLIEDSIRRPDSKTYFIVSVKMDDEWVPVQLNFSAI